MALIWKKGYFELLFTSFSYQGTKIPSAHISLTYMYFAHLIEFFALPILKKKNKNKNKNKNKQTNKNLSGMVSLWAVLFAPFWNNQ